MKRHSATATFLPLVLAALVLSPASGILPQHSSRLIPVTFLPVNPSDLPSLDHELAPAFVNPPAFPTLGEFVSSVTSPDAGVVGVYVPDQLALRVLPQPADNAAFVAAVPGTVTQYQPAAEFGSIGLLAHNTLAGADFERLLLGERVFVVYGDGTTHEYMVSAIRHFQATSPLDPYSDFLDLDQSGSQLSSTELFDQMYSQQDTVVFQTCIAKGASRSWGRLFVTATALQYAAAQD